ncbi:nucleotidyltransferase domain-containing protein [Desulfobulbus rhabdoformis]|nr:nucleotidyltransferase domain-containing protein [Desulfobulbus rhabdoformis]
MHNLTRGNIIHLNPKYIASIISIAKRDKAIKKVVLFGSWAMGNAKPGSDIDIALFGKNINKHTVASFQMALEEETTIPHFFDILHFESLSNTDLIKHIVEYGVQIYSSPSN